MSVTRDTSHSPIGLCGLPEKSPFGDILRNAAITLLSSAFDFGEKARWMGRSRVARVNYKNREIERIDSNSICNEYVSSESGVWGKGGIEEVDWRAADWIRTTVRI